MSLTYYVGACALLLGAWLIFRAANHRKRMIAVREAAEADGGNQVIDTSWQALGASMLQMYAFYAAFASLLLIGGFFLSDLKDHLSIFDLFGLLVLIVAYSGWMIIRVAYHRLGYNSSGSA
jgi:hypothetical protein